MVTVQGTENNVSVFNAIGQLVLTAKGVNTVDLSQMAAGLYFIEVRAGQEKVVVKVYNR